MVRCNKQETTTANKREVGLDSAGTSGGRRHPAEIQQWRSESPGGE